MKQLLHLFLLLQIAACSYNNNPVENTAGLPQKDTIIGQSIDTMQLIAEIGKLRDEMNQQKNVAKVTVSHTHKPAVAEGSANEQAGDEEERETFDSVFHFAGNHRLVKRYETAVNNVGHYFVTTENYYTANKLVYSFEQFLLERPAADQEITETCRFYYEEKQFKCLIRKLECSNCAISDSIKRMKLKDCQ
jgi:hypothetical protein